MKGNMLWLCYRRLRPAIGTSFAFILMYGFITQTISYSLFFIALGFLLIHLFGDCYNDYYDIDEDLRNKRQDKLILSNIISPQNFFYLSFVFLILGLSIIAATDFFMILPASYYTVLLVFYSHPLIRLKKYNLMAYLLGGSVWIITFFVLDTKLFGTLTRLGLIFILFSFSQFVYILCQKDTTDKKDNSNLFLSRGWKKSFRITAFFAIFSSVSLFLLSTSQILLLVLWAINSSTKLILLREIKRNTITRSTRSRLIFIEFLTPYLFVLGGFLI